MTRVPEPKRKWRPSLTMIVIGVLLAVLTLPIAGMVLLAALQNKLPMAADAALNAPGIVVMAVFLFVTTIVIALVLARAITRPVHELTERTARIGQGDREAIQPLNLHGSREIATLSHGFLTMAQKLFDRADYISGFAAHVSHELKSPLTSIKGAAELLQDTGGAMTAQERAKFLDNIVGDTSRLVTLVERLRALAKAENPEIRGSTTLALIEAELNRRFDDISIEMTGDIHAGYSMAAENAIIVFSNLIENARHHGAGRIVFMAAETGRSLLVSVRDNGTGISTGNAEKIFEPFFTTRREAGGTGMGLAIVQTLLAAHDGSIALVDSEIGAAFEVHIPLEPR